mmetsp:Transcript_91097/g.244282  ORF Transcript_91097/g.244282 Transcript_91097/m.244282 type:complete len:231 (-) Transcript_91097:87-779(-)
MAPSTLRMRFAFFLVVICSTASAKSSSGVAAKCLLAYSFINTTRASGLSKDLTRWPIPIMTFFWALHCSTNSSGLMALSRAPANIRAASSRAPPNRGPMVASPEISEETRSLPARAATMVLWAPETQGPWSAVVMTHSSMNLDTYAGSRRLNHRSEIAPPTPSSASAAISEIGTPAYVGSAPRSSDMEHTKLAGFRTKPFFFNESKSAGSAGAGSSAPCGSISPLSTNAL